jgi:uncharacterized protein
MSKDFDIRSLSACLSVSDIAKSSAWYKDILGFEMFYQKDYGPAKVAYLRKKNFQLELIENKKFVAEKRPDPPVDHSIKQGVTHLTFHVDCDLDAFQNELKKKNVIIAFPLMVAEELGLKVMFIRDPDGNLVELNESVKNDPYELLDAVKANDEKKVFELLDKKYDPNRRDPQTGMPPLMYAAGLGNTKVMRELIKAGADVFDTDTKAGSTALHKACQAGSLEAVKMLIEEGAFIDAVAESTGHTPLIEALWFKFPEIVDYLLNNGASLEIRTHYGFSLMEHFQYAMKVNVHGKDKLLKSEVLLNKRQSDDNEKVKNQKLIAAVVANDLEAVKKAIRDGSDIEERSPVLGGFNDHHTPLLIACKQDNAEIVAELLKAGADANATEPTFGAVPLHKATYNGLDKNTQLLVDQPGIDLDFQGYTNGYTPLHDALWHGFEKCAMILIKAGARLDLKGHDGKLPVDIAREVFEKDHPIFKLLDKK